MIQTESFGKEGLDSSLNLPPQHFSGGLRSEEQTSACRLNTSPRDPGPGVATPMRATDILLKQLAAGFLPLGISN